MAGRHLDILPGELYFQLDAADSIKLALGFSGVLTLLVFFLLRLSLLVKLYILIIFTRNISIFVISFLDELLLCIAILITEGSQIKGI